MNKTLQLILDWSEVWALLIPLFVLVVRGKQPPLLKPVIVYLWLALLFNFIADIIGDFKRYFPAWIQSNNPLYNVHSLVRFACFSYFFISLKQSSTNAIQKIIPFLSLLFVLINFSFFENFFNPMHLSGDLLAVEAYLLLIYCMLYYLLRLKKDVEVISGGKVFWVVTGLSIYVVINFFVFLFYLPMIKLNPMLAGKMWTIHNIAYIIFCILIAKAFYVHNKH
ncbi:MAG: hypothetical protein WKF91_10760 [Segetibacter sp.]